MLAQKRIGPKAQTIFNQKPKTTMMGALKSQKLRMQI
jgi:hypothetical protein